MPERPNQNLEEVLVTRVQNILRDEKAGTIVPYRQLFIEGPREPILPQVIGSVFRLDNKLFKERMDTELADPAFPLREAILRLKPTQEMRDFEKMLGRTPGQMAIDERQMRVLCALYLYPLAIVVFGRSENSRKDVAVLMYPFLMSPIHSLKDLQDAYLT